MSRVDQDFLFVGHLNKKRRRYFMTQIRKIYEFIRDPGACWWEKRNKFWQNTIKDRFHSQGNRKEKC